jgi:hypothetical protein
MNDLAIIPDELVINPKEAAESLLWILFDDILVLFWKGYFMYNREVTLKSYGTSLVPMMNVVPNWLKNNTVLYDHLRTGPGKLALKNVCIWRGRGDELELHIPYKYRVPLKFLPAQVVAQLLPAEVVAQLPLPLPILPPVILAAIPLIPPPPGVIDQIVHVTHNAGGRPSIWTPFNEYVTNKFKRNEFHKLAARVGVLGLLRYRSEGFKNDFKNAVDTTTVAKRVKIAVDEFKKNFLATHKKKLTEMNQNKALLQKLQNAKNKKNRVIQKILINEIDVGKSRAESVSKIEGLNTKCDGEFDAVNAVTLLDGTGLSKIKKAINFNIINTVVSYLKESASRLLAPGYRLFKKKKVVFAPMTGGTLVDIMGSVIRYQYLLFPRIRNIILKIVLPSLQIPASAVVDLVLTKTISQGITTGFRHMVNSQGAKSSLGNVCIMPSKESVSRLLKLMFRYMKYKCDFKTVEGPPIEGSLPVKCFSMNFKKVCLFLLEMVPELVVFPLQECASHLEREKYPHGRMIIASNGDGTNVGNRHGLFIVGGQLIFYDSNSVADTFATLIMEGSDKNSNVQYFCKETYNYITELSETGIVGKDGKVYKFCCYIKGDLKYLASLSDSHCGNANCFFCQVKIEVSTFM